MANDELNAWLGEATDYIKNAVKEMKEGEASSTAPGPEPKAGATPPTPPTPPKKKGWFASE